MKSKYLHKSVADLPGLSFSKMRQLILVQVKRSNLNIIEDELNCLTIETAHGLLGLRKGKSCETASMVAGKDSRNLFIMKNAVIKQLEQLMPEVSKKMRWSDGENVGNIPPNFQFARVLSIKELSPIFLRIVLQGENFSAYSDKSIHFRLVLPPKDIEPVWPTIAANGSTIWPQGSHSLHKPVYTTRFLDYKKNTITTDVYMHEGGKITEWAQEVSEGSKKRNIVGIIGPVGAGLIFSDKVFMATDETGFPAATRILEKLNKKTEGKIILETKNGQLQYPIKIPKSINVQLLSRDKGENLKNETLKVLKNYNNHTIWFAGEKKQANAVREQAKKAGFDTKNLRISSFWTI